MAKELTTQELEEIADKIIAKELSIRTAATEYQIPRNILARRLDVLEKTNPEKFEQLKVKKANQRSGGKIKGVSEETHDTPKEAASFYIEYITRKASGKKDSQIMEEMCLSKETFYRKKSSFEIYMEDGKISFTKHQFSRLPEEEKKRVLVLKLRNRYKGLGKNMKSKEECKERIEKFVEYITDERKTDKNISIGKQKAYVIVNSNIDLVRSSFEDKIKPNIEHLDELVGQEITNIMLEYKPFMFSFSRDRIVELVDIAKSHGKLRTYAMSSDRSSPELLYALLEFASDNMDEYLYINQINKCAKRYNYTNEDLFREYPYKAKSSKRKSEGISLE